MGSKGLNKPLLLLRMDISFRCTLATFIFSVCLSGAAYAEPYRYITGGQTVTYASSPGASCRLYASQPGNVAIYVSNTTTACVVVNPRYPDYPSTVPIHRNGDTCETPGSVLNEQTGNCDTPEPANECEAKIGQSHSFGGDMGQMETCVDKCIVVVDASSSEPVTTYKKPGDISKTYWWVSGMFSGEECAASDGTDNSPPAPTESSSDSECTPTTTTDDGSQVSTCTETKVEVDNQGCVAKGGSVGSVNGVMQCVAANKGPKANETTTTTKTETTTKPDGSKTEKTTKTTEQKNCSGAGACSSNTTTNVNNSTTNADGTKGGESSSCTGANCTGDGKGDGSGSGDGKGEGDGEGEGDEEGDGPPGPEGTLKQGEGGDFSEGITEWDQRITDVRADLDQKLGEYSSLFKGVFDLDLGTGGGSLPCENIPISFGTTTTNLRFCLADYSDPLSYLRYALLLGAAALAAVIILRG